MNTVSSIVGITAIITSCTLGGCASLNLPKTPPTREAQTIIVQFTSKDLSGWSDIPMGTYRVPNSQVIISGHQKGNAFGLMFGLAGVAAANAIGSSEGKARVGSAANALQITLTQQAQSDLTALVDSNKFSGKFSLAPNAAYSVLSISGDVVLTLINDTQAIPHVVLNARLVGPKGTGSTWTTRYVASIGGPRPLTGADSWTSDAGAALRMTVSSELTRALTMILMDVSSPFTRDEHREITVTGYYPYMRGRLQVVGYQLTEDHDWLAFAPKVPGTSLLAGVNIMDKLVTKYRPTTKEDRLIKRAD